MTPQEAKDFLIAQKVNLPAGANMIVKDNTLMIGNEDASFVLMDHRLASEELILSIVMNALPSLGLAITQMADQKKAAVKAEADIVKMREVSKTRKPLLRR